MNPISRIPLAEAIRSRVPALDIQLSFLRRVLTLSLLSIAAPFANAASDFPSRPVRIVLPYAAGGIADTVTRLIAQHLSERFHQSVIVENKPGGNGVIGTASVAKASADGYTLLMVPASLVTNPLLMSKLPYDTARDLTAVSLVGTIPMVFAISGKVPASNLKEFLEWSRKNQEQLNYASSGTGGGGHLAALLLNKAARLNSVNVPYKGIGSAIPDILSGQITFAFDGLQSFTPHMQSGKLRVIGIAGPNRLPAAPDVPTFSEAGLPGFTARSFLGILAPANTPRPIVAELSEQIATVIRSPEVSKRLLSYGIEPVGSDPDSFDKFMKAESAKWSAVIRDERIRID